MLFSWVLFIAASAHRELWLSTCIVRVPPNKHLLFLFWALTDFLNYAYKSWRCGIVVQHLLMWFRPWVSSPAITTEAPGRSGILWKKKYWSLRNQGARTRMWWESWGLGKRESEDLSLCQPVFLRTGWHTIETHPWSWWEGWPGPTQGYQFCYLMGR